jgi:hypothetical protein
MQPKARHRRTGRINRDESITVPSRSTHVVVPKEPKRHREGSCIHAKHRRSATRRSTTRGWPPPLTRRSMLATIPATLRSRRPLSTFTALRRPGPSGTRPPSLPLQSVWQVSAFMLREAIPSWSFAQSVLTHHVTNPSRLFCQGTWQMDIWIGTNLEAL